VKKSLNDYLVYHPKLAPRLSDFGFNIPLEDSRSDQVFSALNKKFKELCPIDISDVDFLSKNDIELVHHENTEKVISRSELLRVYGVEGEVKDFYYEDFLESILLQAGGTYTAMKKALASSFCYYLGGGMHHASSSQGDGFCPLNDIVIGIRKLQKEELVTKVLIIDIDAHKGDGTAEITQSDDSIDTLSIHMLDAWPMPDETPGALVKSSLDIERGVGEEDIYLSSLKKGLDHFFVENYDLVVVVGGVDPHEDDELTSTQGMRLTREQMLARDLMVYKYAESRPQIWLMAGGYGKSSASLYEQFIEKVMHFKEC